MLDPQIIDQLTGIFATLKARYEFRIERNEAYEHAAEFTMFLEQVASTSPLLSVSFTTGEDFRFILLKDGQPTGIRFRGIPNGHEFTSLLLAVLNADGQGQNLPDDQIARRIAALRGDVEVKTYVALTCTNCPDVVQALNVMALLNPNLTSETIDGGLYQDEVAALNIQGVPAVYVNGELLHVGRGDLGTLLDKLEDRVGTTHDAEAQEVERPYDLLVLGGGPAGASAAIYSARKGLKVAIVAERIGGQVNDTTGIENLVSVPQTTGTKLSADLRKHLGEYPIDIFDNRRITAVSLKQGEKRISVRGGETFVAPAVVIATGASWRRLGLEDEERYIGHGEHFCPHCDGPFYRDKRVAVIGGGNSGIEAAIDLAGLCSHVTVLEFADTMRADDVLQQKARSLGNVEIFTSTQTTKLLGNGSQLSGLRVKDRTTDEERDLELDGIFVQIGLSPNTEVFAEELELTPRREIPIDASCRTSLPGVYAAGDVTTVPYKQILIAMGEGAKAALAAFDDRIRGII